MIKLPCVVLIFLINDKQTGLQTPSNRAEMASKGQRSNKVVSKAKAGTEKLRMYGMAKRFSGVSFTAAMAK
jgi:hypothetical protein